MRKIVVSEFVTLDGVMEDPRWTFQFTSEGEAQEKFHEFKWQEITSIDALLLGRVTYQGFAAAWPSMKDEQGYADRMNNYPKYVVSKTLKEAKWNNSRIIKGNVVEEISKLKNQAGKDILVFGSGELVNFLGKHDLIDEYRLLTFSVIVGKGKRLFKENIDSNLKLLEARAVSPGMALLRYQVVRK